MLDLVIMIGVCFGVPTIIALLLSGQWRYLRANLWALAATATVVIAIVALASGSEIQSHLSLFQESKFGWLAKLASILVTLVILVILPKTLREETGILNLPRCALVRLV